MGSTGAEEQNETGTTRTRMGDEREFAAVLAAARAGDAGAWGQLYDAVAPPVLGYLRAQSLPDPDDVAGEVLLQLVRDLDRFDGDRAQFRAWALRIARNRMLDARRWLQRRPAMLLGDEQLDRPTNDDEPSAQVALEDSWQRLIGDLDALTEEQREVVVLRVVAELSLEETAQVMGKTVGAVKALQHRAFCALRTILSDSRNPVQLSSA